MNMNGGSLIQRIDSLGQAKGTTLGAAALLCHIIDSRLAVEPPELEAVYSLLIAATETMDNLIEAMKPDITAGNQNADYWRGYEDGKAAAAKAAQQKAIAAQGA